MSLGRRPRHADNDQQTMARNPAEGPAGTGTTLIVRNCEVQLLGMAGTAFPAQYPSVHWGLVISGPWPCRRPGGRLRL
jgi:hypothetical protein